MDKPPDSSIFTVPRHAEPRTRKGLAKIHNGLGLFSSRTGRLISHLAEELEGPWHEDGMALQRHIGRFRRPNAVEFGQIDARGDSEARPEAGKVDVAYAEPSRRSVRRICGSRPWPRGIPQPPWPLHGRYLASIDFAFELWGPH